MATRTPSCEHCGSPCREHTFVSPDDDDDPILILEDIKRLDRAIRRLRVFKAERCRQLNAVRSSIITLPNEILLSIFKFFCSHFQPQKLPQFILGGVCTRWRNLLNTEHLFWRTIDLPIGDQSIPRAASLLEVFRERNHASFKLIQLRFEKLRDRACTFQQLLLPLSGLSTPSKIILYDTPVDFLQMKDTGFDIHDVSLVRLARGTSKFTSIMLGFSPPWSTLTVLTLSHIPINFCCDLLLGCPNLIRFSIHDPLDPTIDCTRPNARQAQEMYFPHMQQLTWHHGYSAWDDNLLSFYHFSALQHFHWLGHGRKHSLHLFHDFTSFLPQSCRTFQLSGPKDIDTNLRMEILQQMAHPVERLICSHFRICNLPIVLERLQDRTFIPSLRLFRWEYQRHTNMTRGEVLEVTQSLKDVIRSRKRIGVGRFRMEIEGMLLPEGFSTQSIDELISGEFDFEIAETWNGRWIISL